MEPETLLPPLTVRRLRLMRPSLPEEIVTSWPTILAAELSLRPGSPEKVTFSPLAL